MRTRTTRKNDIVHVERNLVQAADTDKIVDGFSAFGD